MAPNNGIVEVAKAIKDFDTKHTTDVDYVDKASSKCKDLLAWYTKK